MSDGIEKRTVFAEDGQPTAHGAQNPTVEPKLEELLRDLFGNHRDKLILTNDTEQVAQGRDMPGHSLQ